ncbi:MAG: PepSY-associated TM helix domain-containing protein [Acidobacteriota bacterium]
MSFWSAPRKVLWRKALFQIHLWLGVLLGLYFVVVALTGSIIVYKKEIERSQIPHLTRVEPLAQRQSFSEIVAKVKAAYPHATLSNVYLYWQAGDTFSFRMQSKSEGRIQVYVDPYRNRILGEDRYQDKFLQWAYDLHVNLLLGDLGEYLNGWGGFGLALVSVSGLVIWWPGRRWWRQGFRYESRARWKRQNYDLHKLTGFVSSFTLVLLALTGAYWSFPQTYEDLLAFFTASPVKIPTPRVNPVAASHQASLDLVLENAIKAIPGGTPTLFRPAAKPNEVHSLHHILPGDWRTQGDNVVYIHPATAEVVRVTLHQQLPLGARLQRDIYGLHFGTFWGHPSRLVWVFTGITPAILFVTGLLMWWNRSLSKSPKHSRQAAAVPVLQQADPGS